MPYNNSPYNKNISYSSLTVGPYHPKNEESMFVPPPPTNEYTTIDIISYTDPVLIPYTT